MNANGNGNNNSLYFGAGQYVMAGTNSLTGLVFNAQTPVSGDQTTGTMFIFTDGSYPGLQPTSTSSGQISGIPNQSGNMPTLLQGSVGGPDPNIAFKGTQLDLYGVVGSNNASSALPPKLNDYSGIVWWQDRRNSTVEYNEAQGSPGCPLCTADDGSVLYCANGCPGGTVPPALINQSTPASSANHVTYISPQIGISPGQGRVGLQGVIYQPRGAWLYVNAGNSSFACTVAGQTQQCPLEVVTGALVLDHGTTGLLLSGPTLPIIRYKAALIQ